MGTLTVGQLAEIEGKMDADQFVSILEDHLLPSLEESGIPEEQVIFQHGLKPCGQVLHLHCCTLHFHASGESSILLLGSGAVC